LKETLKRYAERIDAATLRERVMIFLAATVVLVFIANAALIEPLRAKQKRIAAETAQLTVELQGVQTQLATLVQSVARDPDAANRARMAALREQLHLVRRLLQQRVAEVVRPLRRAE